MNTEIQEEARMKTLGKAIEDRNATHEGREQESLAVQSVCHGGQRQTGTEASLG